MKAQFTRKPVRRNASDRPPAQHPTPNTTAGAAPAQRLTSNGKPPKPYEGFPLTPHAGGKWQKKINGRIYYYGRWGQVVAGVMTRLPGDGWKEALALYEAVREDDHTGRERRAELRDGVVVQLRPDTPHNPTVAHLCNHFLTAKKRKLEAGELSPRMFAEYRATTDRMVGEFGRHHLVDDLRPADFAKYRAGLAKQYGPVRIANEVQKVRTIFKFALENVLIEKPVLFGSEFKKPDKKVMRLHRAAKGPKLFSPEEVRALIDTAGVPLRAMTLLGVNAALGNNDVGSLPLTALDLAGGWVTFPRPKTGVERRAKLWPETVAALRDALAERPKPTDKAAEGKVFVTGWGAAWASEGVAGAVIREFGKLMKAVGVSRPGVGFYSLRHTFRTVADAARDLNAVRLVMGHTDDSIDSHYTHGIGDDRLAAVAAHVRAWLYPSKPTEQPATVGEGGAK